MNLYIYVLFEVGIERYQLLWLYYVMKSVKILKPNLGITSSVGESNEDE